MALTFKQAKRVVLAKYPRAHMVAFSGMALVDGVEGIALSDSRKYNNDMHEQHWLQAANKIQEGTDV